MVRAMRFGLLVACPLLVAANVLHVRSTELGDPYGVQVDLALVLTAIALKWFVLVGSVVLLRTWFGHIHGRPQRAVFGLVAIASPLIILTLLLAFSREDWANRLSNDSEKYHSFAFEEDEFAVQDANYSRVTWLWKHGVTQAAECLLIVAIISALALLGVTKGQDSWWIALLAVPGALVLYSIVFGLFVIDFDVFHGDIWSGAVLLDLLFPFYTDPYSLIASLYYTTFACSLAIVSRDGSSRPVAVKDLESQEPRETS